MWQKECKGSIQALNPRAGITRSKTGISVSPPNLKKKTNIDIKTTHQLTPSTWLTFLFLQISCFKHTRALLKSIKLESCQCGIPFAHKKSYFVQNFKAELHVSAEPNVSIQTKVVFYHNGRWVHSPGLTSVDLTLDSSPWHGKSNIIINEIKTFSYFTNLVILKINISGCYRTTNWYKDRWC